MKLLRSAYTRNIIIMMAGLAFFNLGFLQNELRVLQLKDCGALIQVLANTLEEEREAGSESSEEDPFKELFELSLQTHDPWESSFSFATKRHSPFENLFLNPGYKSTFSPPPENFLL
jgi:hypothetical protein